MSAHRPFPVAAHDALGDAQLRHNIGNATRTIRAKRAQAIDELPDWEELRQAGAALKDRVLRHLDEHLLQLEDAVQRAGGTVHWAATPTSATRSSATSRAATTPRRSSRSSR